MFGDEEKRRKEPNNFFNPDQKMEQTFKKPVAQFENSFGILEFKMRFYQKTHQITYGKPAKRIILYQKCFKNIIALRGKFTYLFIQQS